MVYKGKVTGPYLSDALTNALTSTNNYIESDPVFIGDVNGDGRDDFIVKWKKDDENRFLTYRGTKTGTFSVAIRTVPSIAIPYYNAE